MNVFGTTTAALALLSEAAKELDKEGKTDVLVIDPKDERAVRLMKMWFIWFEHVGFRCQVTTTKKNSTLPGR